MLGDDVVQAVKDNKKHLGTEEGRRVADNDKAAEDALDPKLERILKICSGVVAVIIVIVIFLIIGKVAGWWGGSSKDNSAKKVAEASGNSRTLLLMYLMATRWSTFTGRKNTGRSTAIARRQEFKTQIRGSRI